MVLVVNRWNINLLWTAHGIQCVGKILGGGARWRYRTSINIIKSYFKSLNINWN